MRTWAGDDNLWRLRSAIIHQVEAKDATDRDLLAGCILPNLDDRAFFIRKAIGWARGGPGGRSSCRQMWHKLVIPSWSWRGQPTTPPTTRSACAN